MSVQNKNQVEQEPQHSIIFTGEKIEKKKQNFKEFLTLKSMKNLLSCSFLGLILTTVYVLTYGKNVFTLDGRVEAENIGILLFLYSTIIGQIVYNCFTDLNAGVMVFMVCENFILSRKIFSKCMENGDIIYAVTNTLFCCSISALFLALGLFLISRTKLIHYCNYLPKPTLYSYIIFMCYVNVHTGYSLVSREMKLIILVIISSIILFLAEHFISSPFITSIVIMVQTLGFYLCMFLFFYFKGYSLNLSYILEFSVKKSFLNENSPIKFCPLYIFKYFSLKLIDYKIIFKCSLEIISMVLFAVMQFPVAYPTLSAFTNVEYDLKKEITAQSYMNFFSFFLFYPTCISPACSSSYYKSGSITKYHGIFGSLSYIFIIFIGPLLNSIIPKYVLASIPMSIGFHYLLSFINSCKNLNLRELMILAISSLLLFVFDIPLIGLLISIGICTIFYYIDFYMIKDNRSGIDEILSPRLLGFIDLYNFDKKINIMGDDVIINFNECKTMDANARDYLVEKVKDENIYFTFIGRPNGFKRYDDINGDNIKKYNSYCEYSNDN
ncbi:Sulfate transporter protein [Spraguea lophii 42_110]|uniref:Sulfate transporter protein n=1 Tax=Spraguea lophii (strain 42_110) TaxID=1358809 RepID=S7W9W2_SPRLO|nr:Sulfate transporter protein [Spraguea lophii 42_110]